MSQLHLLARFFRENNRGLFSSLEETPINLPEILGSDFYENKIQRSDPNYIAKQNFLKKLGVNREFDLSPPEMETLRLILKGYSSSQIAKQVYRSKRTIEHRVENIKSKLCWMSTRLPKKSRPL